MHALEPKHYSKVKYPFGRLNIRGRKYIYKSRLMNASDRSLPKQKGNPNTTDGTGLFTYIGVVETG